MILVINCGSSSLKYELFRMPEEVSIAHGLCERVGVAGGAGGLLKHKAGAKRHERAVAMPGHTTALGLVVAALTDLEHGVISDLSEIRAVGHRVVHGGAKISESVVITDEIIAIIKEMFVLAPVHNPANLSGIQACRELLPGVPQVAVFDTAFHQTMPPHAYLYGLPYEMYEQHHIRRYGFHGTSHRYVSMIASELLAAGGVPLPAQKVITCHLGNGCSMAAIAAGRVVDTSMGMTPLEGLLMGTRCGDLDPAVVIYLADKLGLSPQEMDSYMNKQSGLLGVSGVSSDMRDIQAARATHPRAQHAYDIFCYRVRKYVGAYAAALGGLSAVVFTAGIGENEAGTRADCVAGLDFLGLQIDPDKNAGPKRKDVPGWDIGAEGAAARLLVIPTDEERMIARDTVALVGSSA
jgi:acetate kinase